MKKEFVNPNVTEFFSAQEYDYDAMFNLMSDLVNRRPIVDNGVEVPVKEAQARVLEMTRSVFGLDENSVKNPKLLKRAIKNHIDDYFEIIEDVVEDMLVQGWNADPFFMQFVEQKNIADGDKNEFYTEQEVLLSLHRVSGDHHDLSVQRLGHGQTFSVAMKRWGAAVGADIRLYLLGREDFDKMVRAIYSAYDRKIKEDIYTELVGIGSKLPVPAEFNKAFKLDTANKAQLDDMIEMVMAANGGSDVMIVGVSSLVKQLSKLTDVDWISNEAKNEKYRTGRVGLYEGHTIVEIPQQLVREADGSLKKLVKTDQLLVLPAGMDKPIKLLNGGDPFIRRLDQIGDFADDTMRFEYQHTFGTAVIVGKYFGNVTVTAE